MRCCGSLKWLSGSYDNKVTPVCWLDAEEKAEAVLLFLFRIAFTASLLKKYSRPVIWVWLNRKWPQILSVLLGQLAVCDCNVSGRPECPLRRGSATPASPLPPAPWPLPPAACLLPPAPCLPASPLHRIMGFALVHGRLGQGFALVHRRLTQGFTPVRGWIRVLPTCR